MEKNMGKRNILTELISFFGVSGREGRVREFIKEQISPFVDGVEVDRLGNLIARKKGKGPRVMLAAHMDEIGLLVKRIEQRGFIYCTAVGGLDPAAFIGNPVHIETRKKGKIHGFITTDQLSAGKYIERVPTIQDIFVDTGLDKKRLERLGVEIGSSIHLEGPVCCTGKGDIILGKALDNRIGCYVLIELAKRVKRPKADTYFVFTVQEEFGLYGAKTSAFRIDPDWGIVVDTTQANDVFPEPSRYMGKGPCITIKDGDFLSNPCLVGWLKAVAKRNRIPYQLEATEEGTTDATIIQSTRGGIPTALLSISVRNIHTTSGIASMSDVENAIRLLHKLLESPPAKCVV